MLKFAIDGAEILPNLASDELLDRLTQSFAAYDFRGGARHFSVTDFRSDLFGHTGVLATAAAKLGHAAARPVRILAFDKTPGANWGLGWHQDRVIAVKERVEHPGFTNWSLKHGIHHVQAPEQLLQHMFSLRLHLDDCPEENGALRIISKSWQRGRISEAEIEGILAGSTQIVCTAKRGEILAMHALTLHASSPAENPVHRRVLHIDYCDADLPQPLRWYLDPL